MRLLINAYVFFLAHLSLKAHSRAYSIGRLHHPHSSNIISSEITRPIKANFRMEPQWVGGMKVCSPHLGHLTMMTAMPI